MMELMKIPKYDDSNVYIISVPCYFELSNEENQNRIRSIQTALNESGIKSSFMVIGDFMSIKVKEVSESSSTLTESIGPK